MTSCPACIFFIHLTHPLIFTGFESLGLQFIFSRDEDDCQAMMMIVYMELLNLYKLFFHGHCNMHNKALLTRDNTRTHRETSVEWNIFIEPLQKNGSTRPSQSQVIFKGLNESEFSFL